ncbi:hypothetical protein JCM10449v2_007194 [Rhodotorula kratochvilovae]
MPHLPTELLDKIFSYHLDSKPTLVSCCLASRSLRIAANPLLYRTIEITYLSNSSPTFVLSRPSAKLHAVLRSKPHFAEGCRKLRFPFRDSAERERVHTRTKAELTSKGFRLLFALCPRVEELVVTARGRHGRFLPTALSEALEEWPGWNDTLRYLELPGIKDTTLQFISTKRCLTALRVSAITSDDTRHSHHPATFRLESLISGRMSLKALQTLAASSRRSLVFVSVLFTLPVEQLLPRHAALSTLTIDFTEYLGHTARVCRRRLAALSGFFAVDTQLRSLTFVSRVVPEYLLSGIRMNGPGAGGSWTALVDFGRCTLPRSLERVQFPPWLTPTSRALAMVADARVGVRDGWRWPASLRQVVWTEGRTPPSEQNCERIKQACEEVGIEECRFAAAR